MLQYIWGSLVNWVNIQPLPLHLSLGRPPEAHRVPRSRRLFNQGWRASSQPMLLPGCYVVSFIFVELALIAVPLVRRVGPDGAGPAHGAGTTHGAGTAHRGVLVRAAHAGGRAAGAVVAAVAKVLLAEGCEALLLGDGVDVGADDEADDVEEGQPQLVGEELLGKGQADGGGDPRDAHDLPEADLDGGADLVVCAGAGDEGHGDQVDAVLDGGNLCVLDGLVGGGADQRHLRPSC
jgi:hypothetical protein